jgi:hypothetical protein
MLKNLAECGRDTLSAIFTAISCQVSSALLPDISAGNCQRALVNESGMITTQMWNAQYISNGRNAWDALCDTTP